MNILIDKNAKFIKKKILVRTSGGGEAHEIFFPKTMNNDKLKTKISFGFPGYPETKIQEIKHGSAFSENKDSELISLELNTKIDFISKEKQSLFYPCPPEDFFEISRTPSKKICRSFKVSQIKNPYALFSFKLYMANRFKEQKKEFLATKETMISYNMSSFIGFFVFLLKNIGKIILEFPPKALTLVKKDPIVLFPILIILTTKLSKFTFVVVWKLMVPLVFYHLLLNRILVIWKKGQEIFEKNKLKDKFGWIYKDFVEFKIFFNGVFRTCNILSV